VSRPTAIAVVVPARDEEELLPSCLDSIAEAVESLRFARSDIVTRVFVVLDACRDGSAGVVAARPEVVAMTTHAGCVGVARSIGVEAAAEWAESAAPGPLWVANTDADSVVPRHWLTTQARMADEGRDLVVGTVRPRPDDLDPVLLAAWRERHSTSDGHEHIHGANLGFSLRAYRAIGGFAPLPSQEDVELVGAMRRAGLDSLATGAIPVTTSGRHDGRAPDGFALYLDGLGA
jgi:glycosyltransferase involved in cell wall biosynthesis